MGYNKAKAEKEWLAWKNAEEKQLRELGVDEDTIQRLHTYDWQEFNSDRRYYQRKVESGDDPIVSPPELPVRDVSSMIDFLDTPELANLLKKQDSITMQILMLRMCGYKSKEIAHRLHLPVNTVYLRMYALRKKVKKIV